MNECMIMGGVTVSLTIKYQCIHGLPHLLSPFNCWARITYMSPHGKKKWQCVNSICVSYEHPMIYGWCVHLSWDCGQTALILILILCYMQHNVVIVKTNCSRPRWTVQREHVPLFTSVRTVDWRVAFEIPWARVLLCHLLSVFLSVIVQFFFF